MNLSALSFLSDPEQITSDLVKICSGSARIRIHSTVLSHRFYRSIFIPLQLGRCEIIVRMFFLHPITVSNRMIDYRFCRNFFVSNKIGNNRFENSYPRCISHRGVQNLGSVNPTLLIPKIPSYMTEVLVTYQRILPVCSFT